jgi:outer membrane protein TolC
MSPEEAVAEADKQVYALVAERRAELMGEAGSFSIEPPADSLRAALLSSDGQAHVFVQELNLVACLQIASENNRQYQGQRESLYLAALDLTLERWRFGWQPAAGAGASANGSLGANDDGASVDGTASISRLFGNGGRLVMDVGAALFGAIAEGEGWDAISNLGVSWTQPLLRGAAREVVMEPLTQSERNLVYAVRNFERFRRTFGLDVATRYYRLVLTRQNVANEKANIEALELVARRSTAFAEAGKLSELEASDAANSLIGSQNRLLSLEASFQTQLDNFKLFLGIPIEVAIGLDLDGLTRLSVDGAVKEFADLDEEQLLRIALTQRLDYLNEVERLMDSERRTRISAEDLKIGLDLSAGLNNNSETGRPLAYRSDGSTWNIGLDLDLPVDQIPERNSYRRSLISLQTDQRDLIELQDSIRADLRDSIRLLELNELTYELQERNVALNVRRARNANMLLEAGRLDTNDYLRAQQSLTSARNATDAARVDFTLTRLQLFQQLELLDLGDDGLVVDWSRIANDLDLDDSVNTENEDGE